MKGCGLADYRLRIADYGLQITDCRLRIADYGLQITDCRLRIADYGLASLLPSAVQIEGFEVNENNSLKQKKRPSCPSRFVISDFVFI